LNNPKNRGAYNDLIKICDSNKLWDRDIEELRYDLIDACENDDCWNIYNLREEVDDKGFNHFFGDVDTDFVEPISDENYQMIQDIDNYNL
jgi:hypothetical protein